MPIQSVLSKTYYYGFRYRDLPIVIYRTVIYNWLQLPLVEPSVCTISMACLIKPDIYPTIQLRNLKNRIEKKGEGRKLKIKESIRKEKKKKKETEYQTKRISADSSEIKNIRDGDRPSASKNENFIARLLEIKRIW